MDTLGIQVSIVNPFRVKAYGQSELIRNKTDKLDAALIARFCRAHRASCMDPAGCSFAGADTAL